MIQLQRKPLSEPQVKLIQDWLNSPGALEFQRLISAVSAEATATAGNLSLLPDEDEGEKADVKLHIQMARNLDAFNKIMDEMRGDGYKFEMATLHSTIVTVTNPQL